MAASAPDDAERMLAHADWLRGLARRLCADAHAADDLAQETWLAALRAPLGEARSLRSYMAGILRNQGRLARRADVRRGARERERAAERGAAAPGVDEALERAELARALVESVLALEEPFRSAVLLRYGEGLSAEEAAARLGVPRKTVESRARRGLARLRERWTRARGGGERAWAAALARLAGVPHHPPLAPVTPAGPAGAAPAFTLGSFGVLLMQIKLVLVALALAGGAGALWWWNRTAAEAARPAAGVAATARAPRAPELAPAALAPAAGADMAEGRAAVAPAPAAEDAAQVAAAPPEPSRLVRGRVFDVEARPLAGVAVGLVPNSSPFEGGPVPPAAATSGPDGAFELAVPPRSRGEVRAHDPLLETLVASHLVDGAAPDLVLVVARHRALAGRVVDERGAPVPGARVRLEPPQGFLARFDAILDHTRMHLDPAVADAEGRFALARAPLVPGASLLALQDGFAPATAPAPDWPAADLELVLRRPELEPGVLAGRVIDEHGLAAAGAWVTLGARCAVADDAGSFRLERTDAEDARELTALLRGHRPGRVRAEPDPATGAPLWPDWIEVRLEGAPLALRGVVVDEQGEPRPGVSLWVEDPTPFGVLGADMGGLVEYLLAHQAGPESEPGDVYWFATATDEAGRFELPGLLARDYTLRLFDGQRLETAQAGPFAAGDPGARVVFPRGPLQELKGRVVSRAGAPLPGIEVALLGATYGGVWTHRQGGSVRTDEQGRFAVPGVGSAQLLLSLSGEGIVPTWKGVALGEELVLEAVALLHAKVELADPGRATAFRVLDAEGGELELYEIGVGGVTRLRSADLSGGRSRALGFPEHAALLVLERDGAEVDRVPLRLRPGELNVLRP